MSASGRDRDEPGPYLEEPGRPGPTRPGEDRERLVNEASSFGEVKFREGYGRNPKP